VNDSPDKDQHSEPPEQGPDNDQEVMAELARRMHRAQHDPDYSSSVSGHRAEEVSTLEERIAEAAAADHPNIWEPGSFGVSIWDAELGRYRTWLADAQGNPVELADWEVNPGAIAPKPVGAQEPVTSATSVTPTMSLPDYLSAVRRFVCRYVALPSEHEAVAIALWVAHAHLLDRLMHRYETSPLLAVTSAEMRSGKSRVLDTLEPLVPRPERMVLPSEAVTYTILAQRPRPTLLLDEADAIFGPRTAERHVGLRAVLNSGNRAGSPVLRVRMEGRGREVERFDVFGPKVVAGIGDLPTTVADRAVPIRMRRRRREERVERFRSRVARVEAEAIRLDVDGVPDNLPYPDVPDSLPDRAADGWEVLLAIAECAGGPWPALARKAAQALSCEEPSTVTIGVRLLASVREAFGTADHLTTTELLSRLWAVEDEPWADWYGKPLTARALAKLLKPYGVEPRHSRDARGYYAQDLVDAWSRYVTDVTDVTGS
jgi:hypothetical protein